MFNQGIQFSRRPSSFLACFLAVMACTIAGAGAARAQSADPADIAEGMRLFHHEADCQACHGWAGDGRKMDNQMPDGANLRESKLDRQTLILTIKCGRPGAEMPAFDKFAYSDGRCYGLKAADLKARQLSMFDPPTTLAPSQIENLPISSWPRSSARGRWTMPSASSSGARRSKPARNFRSKQLLRFA